MGEWPRGEDAGQSRVRKGGSRVGDVPAVRLDKTSEGRYFGWRVEVREGHAVTDGRDEVRAVRLDEITGG